MSGRRRFAALVVLFNRTGAMLLLWIAEAGAGGHLPRITLQSGTCVRSNNDKKEIKQADFPAEAPESNSNEYEAGNAERSVHDLSSECSKESSLIKISESRDHTKNDGGTN